MRADVALLIGALILGGLIGWWFSPRGEAPLHIVPQPTPAVQVPPPGWTEPYGGCKEAYTMPDSDAAKECRRYGLG